MRKPIHIVAPALLIVVMSLGAPSAQGFTSSNASMTVAGWFNWWSLSDNYMTLISNNTWQLLIPITKPDSPFLFAANHSFSSVWKETDQTDFEAPMSGTAEYNTGSDIEFQNIVPGNYLFTINDQTGDYSVQRQTTTNMIRNYSFEDAGSDDISARHWKWLTPDSHGDLWGSAARLDYRAHQGSYAAGIRGTWGNGDNLGGWWQDTAASPGFAYELSAWFWADDTGQFGPFTANQMELKIEFIDLYGTIIDYVYTSLDDVSETWTNISVIGVAPEDTAWARAVVFADGIGDSGSLLFDEVILKKTSARVQNFENWNDDDFSTDGCHTQDWIVCDGNINTNASAGTVIISEYIEGSDFNKAIEIYNSTPQNVSFGDDSYYLQIYGGGSTNPSYQISLTGTVASGDAYVAVAQRPSGVSTQLVALADARYSGLQWFNGDDAIVLRMNGTTGPVLDVIGQVGFDPGTKWGSGDISTLDHTLVRKSFVTFGDTNPSNTFEPSEEWNGFPQDTFDNLGSHTMGGGSGPDGNYADLSESIGSYVKSGAFDNGVGSISFWYRHENGTSPALDYLIQTSTNGVSWTTVGSITNIASAAWKQYTVFVYQPGAHYVRIYHSAGANRLYVDDLSVALPNPKQRSQNFDNWYGDEAYGCHEFAGWQVCTGKVTTTSARSGRAAWLYPGTGNYFMSPVFSNGTGEITFWYRSETADTTNTFNVQVSGNGISWTTVTNGQSSSASYQEFYVYTYRTNTTYVRIVLDSAASALLLDDVTIRTPRLYRDQTFNEWPAASSYGNSDFQGWRIEDGLIKSDAAYSGQAVRFRDNSAGVLSPNLPEGIGNLSFQYRRLSTSGSNPAYTLQISPNGSAWSTLTNLTVTSTNYIEFSRYLFDETNHHFRILRTSGSAGSSIAIFDQISIEEPSPPANVSITGDFDPDSPYTNDQVTLQASVLSRYGAENISVTGYYRVGTSGAFTARSMPEASFASYETSTPIPAQPTGTVVQFYIKVNFEGPGSFLTSPRYYPSNAPAELAWYGIPRARPGQVWINEIDPWNNFNEFWSYTNAEFVELAGPADFDLSDWQIELVDGQAFPYETFDSYDIPAATSLADEDNGYGFFVLGGPAQPARDIMLTNFLSQHRPGLVKLFNEMGGLEDSVPYEGFMLGEGTIGVTDPDAVIVPYTNSVGLSGYGTNAAAFAWTAGIFTPGAINTGQSFDTNGPARDFYILTIDVSTNVVITSTGTNGWDVAPFFTTNLAANPIHWTAVSPFGDAYANGTNTIWFDFPVADANCIFSVRNSQE
ncbi:MAG: lamin tail domain-containing protein [Verrucomicrobia bacterium]|nr:lamin tail domain-containing protein [Verrucomicrobiota bacterium]